MARQIQARVREVTDKPILYLVNTNYHGDHTFGNYAVPEDTLIVAHRLTAERMKDFEQEKTLILAAVDNDAAILRGTRLRLPDITFDETMRIDLGGRVVDSFGCRWGSLWLFCGLYGRLRLHGLPEPVPVPGEPGQRHQQHPYYDKIQLATGDLGNGLTAIHF